MVTYRILELVQEELGFGTPVEATSPVIHDGFKCLGPSVEGDLMVV